MKRKIIIPFWAILLFPMSSCKKFLEQASQDLIRPVTIAHYKELLQGESYFKGTSSSNWIVETMTDNLTAIELTLPANSDYAPLRSARFAYRWDADIENPEGTYEDEMFKEIYRNILGANSCLQELDKASGTEEERAVVKGQAFFSRAYGYFLLANLYAQAYNEARPGDLCVPLILETTPSLKRYNRATIKEVWGLISSDIDQSVTLLAGDKDKGSFLEINYKAALLLAARIALFMGDYDKSISYGEKLLAIHPALRNITGITRSPQLNSWNFLGASDLFFKYANNPEILFTFSRLDSFFEESDPKNYTMGFTGEVSATFSASVNVPGALIDLYTPSDKRLKYWFSPPVGPAGGYYSRESWVPAKASNQDGCQTAIYMRSGEAYLILAEAYARKNNPDNARAIDLLNTLRSYRIEGYTNLTPTDFPDQQAFIQFIWDERRRELCFEELHRWWDLRRIGQPAIRHVYFGKTYQLNAKDPAYLLNFPKAELAFNPGLIPNIRPVRNPL